MIIIYTTYNIYKYIYINENFAIDKIYLESLKSRMGTMLFPSATIPSIQISSAKDKEISETG